MMPWVFQSTLQIIDWKLYIYVNGGMQLIGIAGKETRDSPLLLGSLIVSNGTSYETIKKLEYEKIS